MTHLLDSIFIHVYIDLFYAVEHDYYAISPSSSYHPCVVIGTSNAAIVLHLAVSPQLLFVIIVGGKAIPQTK